MGQATGTPTGTAGAPCAPEHGPKCAPLIRNVEKPKSLPTLIPMCMANSARTSTKRVDALNVKKLPMPKRCGSTTFDLVLLAMIAVAMHLKVFLVVARRASSVTIVWIAFRTGCMVF